MFLFSSCPLMPCPYIDIWFANYGVYLHEGFPNLCGFVSIELGHLSFNFHEVRYQFFPLFRLSWRRKTKKARRLRMLDALLQTSKSCFKQLRLSILAFINGCNVKCSRDMLISIAL